MKNVLKISVLIIVAMFMVNCSNDDKKDDGGTGGGPIPTAGWRVGTANYTTSTTQRNAGWTNSIQALDLSKGQANINNFAVKFNDVTGIAAGTYKIVTKLNLNTLLADEVYLHVVTGFNGSTSVAEKVYAAVPNQSVNATVTITNGKVKIVVPQINIISDPISGAIVNTTFAGTLIEQ